MASHRVLLLAPVTSYRVADFPAAARRLDLDVAVGCDRRQALEQFSAGRTLTVDFGSLDRGLRQVLDYAARHPLQAVVGIDEETTLLAAAAGKALGLPHNPPQAVAATRDKHRLRQALAQAGLPGPRFTLLRPGDDPALAAARTRYPCVLKPLSLSASRGVMRADDPQAFVAAHARIDRLLTGLDGADPAHQAVLVEDFVPGREVAVEGILDGGRLQVLAVFEKPNPMDGPCFEESVYLTPPRMPAARLQAVEQAAAAAVAALGLVHGPVHAEVRHDDAAVTVLEVAARSIGGLCARALTFGAGVGLEELILRHATDMPIASFGREAQATGVMMVPVPAAGRLAAVEGVDAARAVPGVEDVVISVHVGDQIVPLPEGDRYLGFIFARAARADQVESSLRAAHGRLRFRVEPLLP